MVGRSLFKAESYRQAITEFELIEVDFSKSKFVDNAIYAKADCYYNQARYDGAIKNYQRIIDEFPKSDLMDDAISGIQWSLLQQNKTDEALSFADKYINLYQ